MLTYIYGNAAIHVAAQFGIAASIIKLLETGSNINERGEDGDQPIHIVAYNGCTDVLKVLVERGADIHALNNYGLSALQEATSTSTPSLESMSMLLSEGCRVDPPRWSEQSALLQAILFLSDNIQKFNKLLEDDPPLNSIHEELGCMLMTRSPFIPNGDDFCKILLAYNANIHVRDLYGNAPIHVAVQFASIESILTLTNMVMHQYILQHITTVQTCRVY